MFNPFNKLFSRLKNALENPIFKNLGLGSGTGSNGKLPSTGRVARQDQAGCKKIRDEFEKFNMTAAEALNGVQGSVDATKAEEAAEILIGIQEE